MKKNCLFSSPQSSTLHREKQENFEHKNSEAEFQRIRKWNVLLCIS
jgi:hypothetical protein